ncbi:MAG: hypothetical protein ACI86S_000831 [Paracoccaceae bacterium]|jgi:hypothetical protein
MDGGRACSEPILEELSVAAKGGCQDTGKNLPREFGFETGVVGVPKARVFGTEVVVGGFLPKRSFVQSAAKVSKEPILAVAAGCLNSCLPIRSKLCARNLRFVNPTFFLVKIFRVLCDRSFGVGLHHILGTVNVVFGHPTLQPVPIGIIIGSQEKCVLGWDQSRGWQLFRRFECCPRRGLR